MTKAKYAPVESETGMRMQTPTRRKLETFLEELRQGADKYEARRRQGWTPDGWQKLRINHPWIEDAVSDAEAIAKAQKSERPHMGLKEFRKEILRRETFPHMMTWAGWMDDPDIPNVLITTRPESGKTSFLVDYCVSKIADDPDIRIAYSSASEKHAVKQVSAVRTILETNTRLHRSYGLFKPAQGDTIRPWAATKFTVAQRNYDPGSSDFSNYTMEAFGIGGQIEGTRADLFIVDDADLKKWSDSEREKVFEALLTVVTSRLTVGAKLIVLTNRWDYNDVTERIKRLLLEEPDLWKVYSTPAIQKEKGIPVPELKDCPCGCKGEWGDVLWPEKEGSRSRLVGDQWTHERAWKRVSLVRRSFEVAGKSRLFNLIYQNDPAASEDLDFADVIEAALERGKTVHWGQVPPQSFVINSIDPAVSDPAAAMCLAVSGATHTVVDIKFGRRWRTEGLYQTMRDYGNYFKDVPAAKRWWALEGQGPWVAFAEGPESQAICWEQQAQRVSLKTGENKTKGDFAVAALVPIVRDRLVIPNHCPECVEKMSPLVAQLRRYHPDSTEPYDLCIALWLAERIVVDKALEQTTHTETQTQAWRSSYSSWGGGSWALK